MFPAYVYKHKCKVCVGLSHVYMLQLDRTFTGLQTLGAETVSSAVTIVLLCELLLYVRHTVTEDVM